MMTTKKSWFVCGLGGTLAVLLLTGCETTQGLVERRIAQRQTVFDAFPEDTQARLRNGQLEVGDSMDAAWIVYGEATRTYERTTEGSVNLVWSYSTLDSEPIDQFQTVHYPVTTSRGRTYWTQDMQLQRSYLHSRNEYLKIEFKGDKVFAIDRAMPQAQE